MIMKNKRGISPLIAWMLLISISVAIGFFVINWAIENMPEPKPDFNYCEDVSLSFRVPEYTTGDPPTFKVTLINNGYFTIDKISLGAKYFMGNEEWYEILIKGGDGVRPGEEEEIIQSLDDGDLVEVIIVPWVEIEGEIINCNDRKIIISINP